MKRYQEELKELLKLKKELLESKRDRREDKLERDSYKRLRLYSKELKERLECR